jgi:hypothetical protein
LTKVLGQVVGDPLRTDEDEDLGVLGRDLFEVLDELAALLKVGADLDDLSDVEVEGNDLLLQDRLSHSAHVATYQTGGEEELLTLTVAAVMRRNGDEEDFVAELDGETFEHGEKMGRVVYECANTVSVFPQLHRMGRTHGRKCRLTE